MSRIGRLLGRARGAVNRRGDGTGREAGTGREVGAGRDAGAGTGPAAWLRPGDGSDGGTDGESDPPRRPPATGRDRRNGVRDGDDDVDRPTRPDGGHANADADGVEGGVGGGDGAPERPDGHRRLRTDGGSSGSGGGGDSGGSGGGDGATLAALAVVGLVVLAVLYVFRPWFQAPVYGLLIESPHLIFHAVVGVGLGAVAGYVVDANTGFNVAVGYLAVAVLFLPAILSAVGFGPGFAAIYANEDIAERMDDRMETVDVGPGGTSPELPRMDAENARLFPRTVADNIAESSSPFRRYRPSASSRVTFGENGTPRWTYAVEPEGFFNKLNLEQRGVYTIPMDDTQASPRVSGGPIRYGIGDLSTEDHNWATRNAAFGYDYREAFPVVHENRTYVAVPYVYHEWRVGNPLEGRLPIPYSVPTFGGVALVGPDGGVQYLSPQEARENPVLEDQNFYPYSLARTEVRAMEWSKGSINRALFGNYPQLADLPAGDNRQPFVVPSAEGPPIYYLAAEPAGSGQGMYQIFVFDGQVGTTTQGGVKRFTTPGGESLLGPARAPDFAQQAQQVKRLSGVQAVEPIPVVRDDGFYWMVRIVPVDSNGINGIAFVNASSREVTYFDLSGTAGDRPVKRFVAGDRDAGLGPGGGGNESPGGGDGARPVDTVSITVDPGNDTIIVEVGGERFRTDRVVIETKNGTNTTATG